MKCPKCGKEIPDGALFCENCATEIKIVPEYEARLEEQISIGMEEAAKVIAEEKGDPPAPDVPEDPAALPEAAPKAGEENDPEAVLQEPLEEIPEELPETPQSPEESATRRRLRKARRLARYASRRRYVKFMMVFLVGAVFAAACMVLLYSHDLYQRTHSKSYYVGRAYQFSSSGRYQQAADEIDKAIALGPDGNDEEGANDAALYLRKSEYLQRAGEEGLALGAASMVLEDDASTEDDVVAAYGRMIAIYASYEEYDKIAELLSKCSRPKVVENYLQYALFEPEFSEEEGNYEDVLTLTLSDQGDGSIFYTLDGSVPTTNSLLYTGPIQLTEGTYEVSAIYVNHFNLSSRPVTKKYTIASMVPDPPQVTPKSGTYAKQMEITASLEAPASEASSSDSDGLAADTSGKGTDAAQKESADSAEKSSALAKDLSSVKIYYTTDGSDPTADSILYTGPIAMPQGDSVFRFAAFSESGDRSEIVERKYTYRLTSSIGQKDGVNYILVALIQRGEVVDTAGTIPSGTAHYSFTYTGLKQIEGSGNFLIYSEALTDAGGNTVSTGRTYAVNATNGTVNIYSEGTLFPLG